MPTVSLPTLSGPGSLLRLTPTDVTRFVRPEQCERFLRSRLAERAGQDFVEPYGDRPQRITPHLFLSGHTFEEAVGAGLGSHFRAVNYAALAGKTHNRPANNAEVVCEARELPPGQRWSCYRFSASPNLKTGSSPNRNEAEGRRTLLLFE